MRLEGSCHLFVVDAEYLPSIRLDLLQGIIWSAEENHKQLILNSALVRTAINQNTIKVTQCQVTM